MGLLAPAAGSRRLTDRVDRPVSRVSVSYVTGLRVSGMCVVHGREPGSSDVRIAHCPVMPRGRRALLCPVPTYIAEFRFDGEAVLFSRCDAGEPWGWAGRRGAPAAHRCDGCARLQRLTITPGATSLRPSALLSSATVMPGELVTAFRASVSRGLSGRRPSEAAGRRAGRWRAGKAGRSRVASCRCT